MREASARVWVKPVWSARTRLAAWGCGPENGVGGADLWGGEPLASLSPVASPTILHDAVRVPEAARPAQPFTMGRRPAVDGLRGVAIGLVVFHHTQAVFLPGVLGTRWQGGFLGVELFFVLSGFLITLPLLEQWRDRGSISLVTFYGRRATRLLPALWVAMLTHLVYSQVMHYSLGDEMLSTAVIAAGVANWSISFGGPYPADLGQTWTLAVEAQFYLVWPVALILALRHRRAWRVPALIGGLAFASAMLRLLQWHGLHSYVLVYPQTQTYVDALMIGAGAACLMHAGWRPGRWVSLLAVAAAALIVGAVSAAGAASSDWLYAWGYTVVSLATAVVLVASLEAGRFMQRVLSWAPIRYLGRISFSLYLWHYMIFVGVIRALPGAPAAEVMAVSAAITLAATLTSYYGVERPALRFHSRRRRARPRPRPEPMRPAAEGWIRATSGTPVSIRGVELARSRAAADGAAQAAATV